jgi:hypothetical protein
MQMLSSACSVFGFLSGEVKGDRQPHSGFYCPDMSLPAVLDLLL